MTVEAPEKKATLEIKNIKVYQCEDCGQVMFSTWEHNADHTIATIFDSSKIRVELLQDIKAQVQALRIFYFSIGNEEFLRKSEVVALLDKLMEVQL